MARKRNFAMRHLQLKGNLYRFRRGIPGDIQSAMGAQFYVKSLGTGDVAEAKARRDRMEKETDKLFAEVKRTGMQPTTADRIKELGEVYAVALREADDRSDPGEFSERDIVQDSLEASAKAIRNTSERDRLLNIAHGHIGVDHYQDDYLKEVRLAPKTMLDRTGHLNRFARWAEGEGVMLEGLDRRTASRYYTSQLLPGHPRTAKKHLGSLKGYWDWLAQRGHLPEDVSNPWVNLVMPDRRRRVERGDGDNNERPFTTEEMRYLLYGNPAIGVDRRKAIAKGDLRVMDDIIRIGALTGMREADIVTMWAGEVQDDLFKVGHGKTAAAIRDIPVHPDLKEIVERRTKGKGPKDWLFHELKDERDPTDTFGKAFKRYRERLGVADKREGHRRSKVNFHSFRRWFVTEAERAGQPLSTIAAIVGHKEGRGGITFGVYSGGPSVAQKRACVEAVSLPDRG